MRKLILLCFAVFNLLWGWNAFADVPPVSIKKLPIEAQEVLQTIKNGGPYRYARDGIVFGNFERRLPMQSRGFYHEYTVPTPNVRHRGARRIVSGGQPPSIFYYTEDHYETFRKIVE
jgi:ribonuclease T1